MIILFIGVSSILIWFFFFFEVNYEYQAFILKHNNTIYCIASNKQNDVDVYLRIQNKIYETTMNFIKSESTWHIYFIDNLDFNLDTMKLVEIHIIKTTPIIGILT